MFKQIRVRLTLFSASITICILALFVGFYLYLSESALRENHELSLRNAMNNLCTSMENQSVITFQYLNTMEQESDILIYLWDRGVPLHFNSISRHQAYSEVSEEAYARYLDLAALSGGQITAASSRISFQLEDSSGAVYDAFGARLNPGALNAVQSLSAANAGAGLTLLVLSPHDRFQEQLSRQRFLFCLAGLAGAVLLALFSWHFTGYLLKPLRENQARQLQFISDASHELRTPLAVIRSSISIRPPRYGETIEQECGRMGQLIDEMLTLTHLEGHVPSGQMKDLDMDTLLLSVYERFEPLAMEKGLSLSLKLPESPLPHLRGNESHIGQLFSILLENALSYTPAPGSVTLSASTASRGRDLCISIRDTGIGIPDEDKKHIFERFYRVESSHTRKDHFGLGLCIAREIAQAHGAVIRVTDTPGGGTTFTVTFKITD